MTIKKDPYSVTQYVGGRLAEVVTGGMPEVGWDGDPHLFVRFNPVKERWDIYDGVHNPPERIFSREYRGIGDLDHRDIAENLRRTRIPRRGQYVSLWDQIDAHNKAIEEEAAKDLQVVTDEAIADMVSHSHRRHFSFM